MWDEEKLKQAIALLENFRRELWQIDRDQDSEILQEAEDVLIKQLNMLNELKGIEQIKITVCNNCNNEIRYDDKNIIEDKQYKNGGSVLVTEKAKCNNCNEEVMIKEYYWDID